MSAESKSSVVKAISVNPSQAWDGNDGPWSTFILGIGTPPQFVHVLISTTCPQPWAVHPDGCTPQDPPDCGSTRGGIFLANQSSTWRDAGFFELQQELNLGYTGNGDFGFDSIVLGVPGTSSGTYALQHQLLAGIATKEFYVPTWGIAPRPTNLTTLNANDSYPSVLSNLRDEGKIPSLSYAYTAGAPYRFKGTLGSLTLGGYDAARYVASNTSFRLALDNSRDLVVGVQSITASSTTQGFKSTNLLPSPILSFIDSTIPHIWLPLSSCQAFEATFGLEWDPFSELYLVNDTTHNSLMAQNASLAFQISTDTTSTNGVEIILPYASFDLVVTDTYPNVNATSRYFPLKRAANESQYTLGRTILQEMYLIVDYERSSFSVHQCAFSENVGTSIQPILSINLTNTSSPLPVPSPAPSSPLSNGTIAGIVIAVCAAVVLIAAILTYSRRRHEMKVAERRSEDLDATQCAQEFEVEGEANSRFGIGGQPRKPELHDEAKVEVDAGVAAYEVIDKSTAVHELP